jgi:phenylacetaldehyde dehydrogenase
VAHTESEIELGAKAKAFFARTDHGLLIDGQSIPAKSGGSLKCYNPSTGALLGMIADGGVEDVDAAVVSARRAFQSWSTW